MTNNLPQIQQAAQDVIKPALDSALSPFWVGHWDFWIGSVIGTLGLLFAILAFLEARQAKRAATEAGKTVRIQTITIELSEISQKLDKLQTGIHFNEARDMLNEITRRLRRIVSPFRKDAGLADSITSLTTALAEAKESLGSVRPVDASMAEAPGVVYYAIEANFAEINNSVADLLGLFEKKTINFGEEDGE